MAALPHERGTEDGGQCRVQSRVGADVDDDQGTGAVDVWRSDPLRDHTLDVAVGRGVLDAAVGSEAQGVRGGGTGGAILVDLKVRWTSEAGALHMHDPAR